MTKWDRSPLQGAVLSLVADPDEQGLAVTNSLGEAVIAMSEGEQVQVDSAGYESVQAELGKSTSDVHEVCLMAPDSIAGTVSDVDGRPPQGAVRVLACATGRDVSAFAREAVNSKDEAPLVLTLPDGRFLLEHMDPAEEYTVVVGGSGYIQFRGGVRTRPSPQPISIEVRHGFGAVIRLVNEAGLPFDLGRFSPGTVTYEAGCRLATAFPCPNESPSAILGGTDLPSHRLADAEWGVLFTHEASAANVPCYFSAQIPGCDLVRLDFLAVSTRLPLPTLSAHLRVATAGWGAIELKFVYGAAVSSSDFQLVPAGVLALEDLAGARIVAEIEAGELGPRIVRGIPHGQYRWRFTATHSAFTFPQAESDRAIIAVGDKPEMIEVRLPPLGSLNVTIRRRDGSVHEGRSRISLGLGAPRPVENTAGIPGHARFPNARVQVIKHSTLRDFATPPYRIDGLPSGKYYVRLDKPFVAMLPTGDQTVTIIGDQEVSVEFVEP